MNKKTKSTRKPRQIKKEQQQNQNLKINTQNKTRIINQKPQAKKITENH